jgi:hypothetical protein
MSGFIEYSLARDIAEDVYNTIVPAGWQFDDQFGVGGQLDLSNGFFAYALKPLDPLDQRRVLAFRGTEPGPRDFFADASTSGEFKEGRGETFTLYLPFAAGDAASISR